MSLLNRITEAKSQFSKKDIAVARIRNSLRASLEMFDRDYGHSSKTNNEADMLDALDTIILNLRGAVGEFNKQRQMLKSRRNK
jgi:hypothetical protein